MKSLRSPEHLRLMAMLVSARDRAGLTQQQLADRLGKPQSFVAKYEGGERRLDVVEFMTIARALMFDWTAGVQALEAEYGPLTGPIRIGAAVITNAPIALLGYASPEDLAESAAPEPENPQAAASDEPNTPPPDTARKPDER